MIYTVRKKIHKTRNILWMVCDQHSPRHVACSNDLYGLRKSTHKFKFTNNLNSHLNSHCLYCNVSFMIDMITGFKQLFIRLIKRCEIEIILNRLIFLVRVLIWPMDLLCELWSMCLVLVNVAMFVQSEKETVKRDISWVGYNRHVQKHVATFCTVCKKIWNIIKS